MTKEQLSEKVITIANKVDAAHNRLDKFEKQVSDQLSEISVDLKAITAWMNRGKGWAAAALLLAGLAGSALTKLILK